MRVEQRMAGFTGLGQKSDVHIYNFATLNTIEEHIIWLLHEKIDLFGPSSASWKSFWKKWIGKKTWNKTSCGFGWKQKMTRKSASN